jgi:uncharacterized membrane protein
MHPAPLRFDSIFQALAEGWSTALATRGVSIAYAGIFALGGLVILSALLVRGFTPFVLAAAGAFMLVGPVILAGFFGIAHDYEYRGRASFASIGAGFRAASAALWVLALISALLFMIFLTDAAILYSYMVGGTPVGLADLPVAGAGVADYLFWGGISGLFIALLLYCVSAFSVPLLCERRAGLVNAVVTSVRIVLGNLPVALTWAALLGAAIIGSILLLPLLPVVLPWMAFASRALYRQVLPTA